MRRRKRRNSTSTSGHAHSTGEERIAAQSQDSRPPAEIGVLVLNTREFIGSVQHVHAALACGLAREGFAVFAATPLKTDEALEWENCASVTVWRLPLGRSIADSRGLSGAADALIANIVLLWSLLRLSLRVRRNGVQVIHTAVTPRDSLGGFLLSLLTRAALVVHWHLDLGRDFPPDSYPLVWRLAFRRARAILAVSEPSAQSLRPLGLPPSKITVLHNGVDVHRFRPDAALFRNDTREKLGVSPEAFVVLLPGRLRPHKGGADLLAAVALLRERGCDITAVLVGRDDSVRAAGSSGPFKPELERLCTELGIRDHVRILDHRDDMPLVFAAADVVVVPSRDEPFGLVVIEAMACERPVIAAASGGIPEIIDDGINGLLVPPGAPAALATAIERLKNEPELRHKVGRAARQHAEARFSVERVAADLGVIYQSLVERT